MQLSVNYQRPMNSIILVLKQKIIAAACIVAGFSLSLFVGVYPFVLFMLFLVFIDYNTGKMAARAVNAKLLKANDPQAVEPHMVITSSGKRRTIDKMIVYGTFIIGAEFFNLLFIPDFIFSLAFIPAKFQPFTYAASLIICSVEFLSFAENAEKITGNRELLPFVKSVFTKAKSKMQVNEEG